MNDNMRDAIEYGIHNVCRYDDKRSTGSRVLGWIIDRVILVAGFVYTAYSFGLF